MVCIYLKRTRLRADLLRCNPFFLPLNACDGLRLALWFLLRLPAIYPSYRKSPAEARLRFG